MPGGAHSPLFAAATFNRPLAGLETCEKAPIRGFVKFTSPALEQACWRVENDVTATFAAVRYSSALQPEHLDRLRRLSTVHRARGTQDQMAFAGSRLRAGQQARRFWPRHNARRDCRFVPWPPRR